MASSRSSHSIRDVDGVEAERARYPPRAERETGFRARASDQREKRRVVTPISPPCEPRRARASWCTPRRFRSRVPPPRRVPGTHDRRRSATQLPRARGERGEAALASFEGAGSAAISPARRASGTSFGRRRRATSEGALVRIHAQRPSQSAVMERITRGAGLALREVRERAVEFDERVAQPQARPRVFRFSSTLRRSRRRRRSHGDDDGERLQDADESATLDCAAGRRGSRRHRRAGRLDLTRAAPRGRLLDRMWTIAAKRSDATGSTSTWIVRAIAFPSKKRRAPRR